MFVSTALVCLPAALPCPAGPARAQQLEDLRSRFVALDGRRVRVFEQCSELEEQNDNRADEIENVA